MAITTIQFLRFIRFIDGGENKKKSCHHYKNV